MFKKSPYYICGVGGWNLKGRQIGLDEFDALAVAEKRFCISSTNFQRLGINIKADNERRAEERSAER